MVSLDSEGWLPTRDTCSALPTAQSSLCATTGTQRKEAPFPDPTPGMEGEALPGLCPGLCPLKRRPVAVGAQWRPRGYTGHTGWDASCGQDRRCSKQLSTTRKGKEASLRLYCAGEINFEFCVGITSRIEISFSSLIDASGFISPSFLNPSPRKMLSVLTVPLLLSLGAWGISLGPELGPTLLFCSCSGERLPYTTAELTH